MILEENKKNQKMFIVADLVSLISTYIVGNIWHRFLLKDTFSLCLFRFVEVYFVIF